MHIAWIYGEWKFDDTFVSELQNIKLKIIFHLNFIWSQYQQQGFVNLYLCGSIFFHFLLI